MKPIKIIGIAIAGAVGLLIVALLVIYLVVNPNDFKPRITAAVKNSTGRDLNLQGDIKLSVFPWVALTLGPASLGNPPGFGDTPFLSFKRADVRVKLLPLLSKRLEVAKVVLDGLDLRLVKMSDGHDNWEMKAKDEPADKPSTPAGATPSLSSINGIAVTHGRVSYNEYVVNNLDFQTGAIADNQPISVTLALDASRGVVGERAGFKGTLQLKGSADTKDIRVDSLSLQGEVQRAGSASLHYDLSATVLEVNVEKQTLSLPDFALGLGAAKITGKLSGTRILDDLHLEGSVALAQLALRDFTKSLGVALPVTRDARALTTFSARTGFGYDAAGVKFQNLQMTLDDTTLKGEVSVATGAMPAIKFKLSADRIDLDRYRPPVASASQSPEDQSKSATAGESAPMAVDGTFALGAAHAAGLDFSGLSVTVQMKDKIIHLHPVEATLYGGRYSGNLTYDTHAAIPSISMDEHLMNVDLAQLLADTKAKGRAVGRANVNIKGTASGAGADDLMKSLNGHFDANLANGALSGIDVGYELALAQSLLNKQLSTSVPNTHQTAFNAFKASAQITNGIADTRDLVISSPVVKMTGQGTINLPTSGIDMTLLASFLKSGGASAADVPLKVSGTYLSPSVKPDLTQVAKDQLKQKAQDLLKKNGIDLNSFFKKK